MTPLLMLVLLLASAVVSASETALFSLSPAERRRLIAQHAPVAAALRRPSSLLVTLLLANLLVNVAYFSVGAHVSLALVQAGRGQASALFAAASVVVHICCGEILPKTLALVTPPGFVVALAPLLLVLRVVLMPLVLVGESATRLVQALLPAGPPQPDAIAADDFKTAVSRRAALGTYHAVELALLHDVIDFGERRARNLMVPRVDVAFLDVRASRAAWIAEMARRPYSDYPVFDGTPDRLLGTVNAARLLAHPGQDTRALLDPALYAPLSIGAERLVERMQQQGRRLAILLDEHGGVAGVVGFNALSQAVLGELAAPPGGVGEQLIVRRAGDTLLVRGDCPLHVLLTETGLALQARRADTVAGAVTEALGHVPRVSDEV
ncbi:MAG TPA: CNNM domain-containing protein, partial [Planctomycetota bacterium]|nr:CNNM domain-containing protein [Planctomycetota bacterium]